MASVFREDVMSAMEPSSLSHLHITVSSQPIGKLERAPEKYTRLETFTVHGGRVYAYLKKQPEAAPMEIALVQQLVKEHLERLRDCPQTEIV